MKKQQGFNHNMRHRGILFHVQTEDYGIELHKIVTQLFSGGQIISKIETDYQEIVDDAEVGPKVSQMMKSQHKKMLEDLSQGVIDIPENLLVQAQQGESNDD